MSPSLHRQAQSPAAYEDCKLVLDTALLRGGVSYTLPNPTKATQFAQRCYRYRALLRQLQVEQHEGIPGFRPTTTYDRLRIVFDGPRGETSTLRFETIELSGTLRDLATGEELKVELPPLPAPLEFDPSTFDFEDEEVVGPDDFDLDLG